MRKITGLLLLASILLLTSLLEGCQPQLAPQESTILPGPSTTNPALADVIAKYREVIPQQMQKRNIPGLAIVVVDGDGVVWQEGFGYTGIDRRVPVTPSTIFSLQSISKSFTATAVMIAAQEGLVSLDEPITTYLPEFTVNSIFEEHPEQKMTLRILLSHTAGFPHDTAYGGNNDGPSGAPPYSFEKHIASISDTWLMFPVGTHYSYSNIGIDLAGYILQVQAGMPFIQYVQEKILDPLGMKDSTLDYRLVRAKSTRAIGHTGVINPPVDFQLLPSGGVWSSAEDMANYLLLHINRGALGGDRFLREDLAETMYTPPNQPARNAYPNSSYALGVTVGSRNGAKHFQHGGGGFGFSNSMVWYPELQLGSVVLTNFPQPDAYCVDLSENVLDDIITSNIPLYRQRFVSHKQVSPAYPADRNKDVLSDDALRDLIASQALPQDTTSEQAEAKPRRSMAVGTYFTTFWGIPAETIEIKEWNDRLTWYYNGGMDIRHIAALSEVQSGLFFSADGNLLDLRGPVAMLDNNRLIKTDPRIRTFQMILYGLCGLVFISALIFWPVRSLLRRRRRAMPRKDNPPQGPASPGLVAAGILAALASLFGLICIALTAAIPNLVFIPWPRPFVDLAWWQFALVSLPFASLLLSVGVVLLATWSIRKSGSPSQTNWYFLALGLILLAFYGMVLL